MSELPFESVIVPGDRAVQVRREHLATPGIVPIILGAPTDLVHLVDNLAFLREDPAGIVARAQDVDVAAWYEQRYEDDPTSYEVDEGDWPRDTTPNHDLLAVRDPESGDFLPEVVIGLVPAAEPWMVPAVLGFGGWNDCPHPHEHVALFKRWHERFGADVASLVGGLIELEVARPPLDRDTADLLAMEHFLYCPGVIPDDGSLAELASTLMFGTAWSFEWE